MVRFGCSGEEQRSQALSWAAMEGGGVFQRPPKSILTADPQSWSCISSSDKTPRVPRLPRERRDLPCWLPAGHLEEREHRRGDTCSGPITPAPTQAAPSTHPAASALGARSPFPAHPMMLVLRAFSSLSSTLTRRASAPLLALSTISSSVERAGAARAPEMLLTGGPLHSPSHSPTL